MAAEDIKKKIETANEEVVKRLNAGDPVLVDIAPAGEVIPGLQRPDDHSIQGRPLTGRACAGPKEGP